MKLSKTNLLLLFFIIAGLLFRLYNLSFQNTNWDEIFTMNFASPSLSAWQIIVNALSQDFTPPPLYLVSHFSMLVFGMNAWAIRFPPVIFGTLLIPVMYFIGKEYRDDLFGLLLAGFTAISYSFFYYSRYGRSYSLALLFFSLAFYFLLRISKNDAKAPVWFGLFALLSVWTHLYSVIPIGIMVLWLLYQKKAYSGIAILVIGSLPLLMYIPIILTTRIAGVGGQVFEVSPAEIVYGTPTDLFGYSGLIIFPIILWSLWMYRSEEIVSLVTIMLSGTWASMLILSFRTPIILHYSLFLVPALLLPFILPFYDAIRKKGLDMPFYYVILIVLIVILELIQIGFTYTIQRV